MNEIDFNAPERIVRRDFLQRLAAAGAAALMGGEPIPLRAAGLRHPQATADACIVLWMGGGMAAPETFDPKRYLPFEKGLKVERVLSTFPSIRTAVDNIRICQGLERLAGVMDRATLVRSAVQPDLGHILHSRHQYHWHTGYVPPQTVACPHIGAWMARVLGRRNPVMPAFINIGQELEGNGESEEVKAFTTAGFFGREFGPLNLPFPERASQALRPPDGMTPGRFADRSKFYRRLVDQNPDRAFLGDYQRESMLRAFENADRLLASKERKAFDIHLEPREAREAYDTGRFGRGCLLARRLIENGARFVEVAVEFRPFQTWDTHSKGHAAVAGLHREIDRPIARLVLDLEARGLLDRTLIVLASEFSRDAVLEGQPGSSATDQAEFKGGVMTEAKHYGLHRHFTGGTSALLFGGGMKKGFLYGRTADERPLVAVHKPVSVTDLHATIMTAMGIHPATAFEIEGRPFHVTRDGGGKAVGELFA